MKTNYCCWCEFYDPFYSDIFHEYTNWGTCDKSGDDISGEDHSCELFNRSTNTERLDFMNRCWVLYCGKTVGKMSIRDAMETIKAEIFR